MKKIKPRWVIVNVSKGVKHDEGEPFKIDGFPVCCPSTKHCMPNIN